MNVTSSLRTHADRAAALQGGIKEAPSMTSDLARIGEPLSTRHLVSTSADGQSTLLLGLAPAESLRAAEKAATSCAPTVPELPDELGYMILDYAQANPIELMAIMGVSGGSAQPSTLSRLASCNRYWDAFTQHLPYTTPPAEGAHAAAFLGRYNALPKQKRVLLEQVWLGHLSREKIEEKWHEDLSLAHDYDFALAASSQTAHFEFGGVVFKIEFWERIVGKELRFEPNVLRGNSGYIWVDPRLFSRSPFGPIARSRRSIEEMRRSLERLAAHEMMLQSMGQDFRPELNCQY